jgi:hypothetical protein
VIEVTIGTSLNRQKVTVSPDSTPRQVLEENGIDYSTGTLHLDGATVMPGDLDKTFAEHGITEKCFLISVVKADSNL